jgi:hypothetical protein
VDQRLSFMAGEHRPHRLTQNENPELAKAILGVIRGQTSCERGYARDLSYIWFHDKFGTNIVVRADDWAKVVPYLQSGDFDPSIVPVPRQVVLYKSDGSLLDLNDQELYNRIKNALDSLFTIKFPED